MKINTYKDIRQNVYKEQRPIKNALKLDLRKQNMVGHFRSKIQQRKIVQTVTGLGVGYQYELGR